jgi:hypothetical protein
MDIPVQYLSSCETDKKKKNVFNQMCPLGSWVMLNGWVHDGKWVYTTTLSSRSDSILFGDLIKKSPESSPSFEEYLDSIHAAAIRKKTE